MLEPGERVLVAVSGGKDSLGPVGPAARPRLRRRRPLPRPRDRRRTRTSRPPTPAPSPTARGVDAGRDRPAATTTASTSRRRPPATGRVPCSACGLSKRHLFDQAGRDGGYDVVATGHNLDDEAAVLFGNVLALGHRVPRPASCRCCRPGHGFPRKVKPLVRLAEREMAAYCVLRGIDYIVEECPMAAGNRTSATRRRSTPSSARRPAPRRRSTSASSSGRRAAVRAGTGRPSRATLQPLRALRRARHRRGVRVLPAERRRGHAPVPVPAPGAPPLRRRPAGPG